ncbi:MAG: hypothetical protein R3E64_03240 [Halioglobus sp.]
MKGDLSALSDAPATAIDVSPDDALKGTEASFMLMLEAKKHRQGMLLDIFYSDVLQESESNAATSTHWKASSQDTLVTAGYTYEIYRSTQSVVDIVAGARYWGVDTKLALATGDNPVEQVNDHNSQSWIDPLAGIKAKVRLSDSRFYLAYFVGAGGVSGGSDSFYDLTANVGYQFTDTMVASVGYRILDVDYQNDSFVYDVKQEGWILGLVWLFGPNKLVRPDATGKLTD